jgi:hypothetical protein
MLVRSSVGRGAGAVVTALRRVLTEVTTFAARWRVIRSIRLNSSSTVVTDDRQSWRIVAAAGLPRAARPRSVSCSRPPASAAGRGVQAGVACGRAPQVGIPAATSAGTAQVGPTPVSRPVGLSALWWSFTARNRAGRRRARAAGRGDAEPVTLGLARGIREQLGEAYGAKRSVPRR